MAKTKPVISAQSPDVARDADKHSHEHQRRRHAHNHGHSHGGPRKQRQQQSSGPSWTRIIVVCTVMILFMIPTVWLWQEAKKVQKAKEDSMRQYMDTMSKLQRSRSRRTPDADNVIAQSEESGADGSTGVDAALDLPKRLGLVHIKDGGDLYDHVVAPASWNSPFAHGPNGDDLVWAVFFYKPYCGACRRVRPVVEALAATTQDWLHLRFAAVDCVQQSYFCTALDADETPVIHLFKRNPAEGRRVVVASWRGMLVSYAIINWFREQQTAVAAFDQASSFADSEHISAPILSPLIEWPTEDELAQEMIAYKQRRQHSYNERLGTQSERVGTRPNDPAAYLTDIKVKKQIDCTIARNHPVIVCLRAAIIDCCGQSAFHFGLVDYVFPSRIEGGKVLTGRRLLVLLRWLDACAASYPGASERRKVRKLRRIIAEQSEWGPGQYRAALASWGHNQTLGVDNSVSWRACQLTADGQVGGYSCAVWKLFHVLLANARPANAYETLQAIVEWIEEFFGCRECARHFAKMWEAEGITAQHENMQPEGERQIHAAMWLWQAHNLVRARLHAEHSNTSLSGRSHNKWQFPSIWSDCEACFTPSTQDEWAKVRDKITQGREMAELPMQLEEHVHFDPKDLSFGYTFEVRSHHMCALILVRPCLKRTAMIQDTKPRYVTMTVYTFLQELYCYGSDTLTYGTQTVSTRNLLLVVTTALCSIA